MADNFIWITTQFVGFHSYPNAPDQVKFLKSSHRHIFYVKVSIEVFHNDRDLEFFMFKDFVNSVLPEDGKDLKSTSCEMLGDQIADEIMMEYPGRRVIIEVSEDGECGSHKEYLPDIVLSE